MFPLHTLSVSFFYCVFVIWRHFSSAPFEVRGVSGSLFAHQSWGRDRYILCELLCFVLREREREREREILKKKRKNVKNVKT